MPYQSDTNQPPRDRRVEYGLADKAREETRKEDATHIDPAASKWRYRATQPTPKNTA
jgi:hypothetical protein